MDSKKNAIGKEARPSSGGDGKSRGKKSIADITRRVTGLDSNDILFESKRKEIERMIKGFRNVSDIPKEMNLNETNFQELSELVNKILSNDEVREINDRIVKPKKEASIKDYEDMIKVIVDIINKRPDDDYEKGIINDFVEEKIYNSVAMDLIEEIKCEVDDLYENLFKLDLIMPNEESTKYILSIKNKIKIINNDLKNEIQMYELLQKRVNKLSEKYDIVHKLEKIDLNDIQTLGVDFVGELFGLPTTEDMKKVIDNKIKNKEL